MVRTVMDLAGRAMSVVSLLTLVVVAGTGAVQAQDRAGAVYVMTNQIANSVSVFNRRSDGSLTPAGTFLTGGAGLPTGVPGGNPNDPLTSQGSVRLSDSNQLLFAVNAGSNEISEMAVTQEGLTLVDKISSGGQTPTSLALHKNLLYVLNAEGVPNMTGFVVSPDRKLSPLPGSTRPLSGGAAAAPAEIEFSPDGSVLAVTEKDTNIIDVYLVGSDGLTTGPIANLSVGIEPFGFAFAHPGILVDSETFQGAPAQGAASSYRVADSGELQVISPSVHDTQSAPCWLVITDDHRFAFVTNTASGSVSSYQVAADGTLTLLNPVAASPGPVSFPVDMALSEGSRYLYLIANNLHSVVGYRVGSDGSLVQVANVAGLPPASQGIAAK